jgi:hypothetical protein
MNTDIDILDAWLKGIVVNMENNHEDYEDDGFYAKLNSRLSDGLDGIKADDSLIKDTMEKIHAIENGKVQKTENKKNVSGETAGTDKKIAKAKIIRLRNIVSAAAALIVLVLGISVAVRLPSGRQDNAVSGTVAATSSMQSEAVDSDVKLSAADSGNAESESKEQINDASQAAGNFSADTLSENKAQINDASGSKMSEDEESNDISAPDLNISADAESDNTASSDDSSESDLNMSPDKESDSKTLSDDVSQANESLIADAGAGIKDDTENGSNYLADLDSAGSFYTNSESIEDIGITAIPEYCVIKDGTGYDVFGVCMDKIVCEDNVIQTFSSYDGLSEAAKDSADSGDFDIEVDIKASEEDDSYSIILVNGDGTICAFVSGDTFTEYEMSDVDMAGSILDTQKD